LYSEILVFACNWNGWSCIETASGSGLSYPPSVKIMRVSCLSRVHTGLILKAFELGADGVMLLGCESDSCHFGNNREQIMAEYEKARAILEMLGIRKDRLVLVQLPAFAGQEFVQQVTKLTTEITRMPTFRGARIAGPVSAQDARVQSLI